LSFVNPIRRRKDLGGVFKDLAAEFAIDDSGILDEEVEKSARNCNETEQEGR
jgi:hypothetical protein